MDREIIIPTNEKYMPILYRETTEIPIPKASYAGNSIIGLFKRCSDYVRGYNSFAGSFKENSVLKVDFDSFCARGNVLSSELHFRCDDIRELVSSDYYTTLESEISGKKSPKLTKGLSRRDVKDLGLLCNDIDNFEDKSEEFSKKLKEYKDRFDDSIWPKRAERLNTIRSIAILAVSYGGLCLFGVPGGCMRNYKNDTIKVASFVENKCKEIKREHFSKPENYEGLDGSEDEIVQKGNDENTKNMDIDAKRMIAHNPDGSGY